MAKIVVVGGGVVGISCALSLQADGHDVVVLDPGEPGEGASRASCGSIAVSEVVPLSKPGTLRLAPKWLLDPKGPLALRPASLLAVLPWFLRFAGNARGDRIRSISRDIALLTAHAVSDTEDFLDRYGLRSLLREVPVIQLFDSKEELEKERGYLDLRRDLGFQIDVVSGNEAAELEPALAKDFAAAAVLRDWRSVVDPKRYVVELHKAFAARGGEVRRLKGTGFNRQERQARAVRTQSGEAVTGDAFVIAAGAASKDLVSDLGFTIQLAGVIGYQSLLKAPGIDQTHALIYGKGGFGITPYESGLAVAGSVEFASASAAPDWRRADILVERARRVLPGLTARSAERYFGRRPLTPDTKPIIGRAPTADNVVVATGHGQLGLTLAATTGRLVRDLVANRRSNVNLSAYRADRF
ncbi:FAD-binding oxidoreductase [Pelagibius sp.]|uniref:NAD(P)/FAD-dependent oxidoreductase n=1 Tax=Pelagibius sp. TaxID=1931238 RepID=UPI00261CA221|nr:FAD-dependent oxidoreductase [Pelagibius sp.]